MFHGGRSARLGPSVPRAGLKRVLKHNLCTAALTCKTARWLTVELKKSPRKPCAFITQNRAVPVAVGWAVVASVAPRRAIAPK